MNSIRFVTSNLTYLSTFAFQCYLLPQKTNILPQNIAYYLRNTSFYSSKIHVVKGWQVLSRNCFWYKLNELHHIFAYQQMTKRNCSKYTEFGNLNFNLIAMRIHNSRCNKKFFAHYIYIIKGEVMWAMIVSLEFSARDNSTTWWKAYQALVNRKQQFLETFLINLSKCMENLAKTV